MNKTDLGLQLQRALSTQAQLREQSRFQKARIIVLENELAALKHDIERAIANHCADLNGG